MYKEKMKIFGFVIVMVLLATNLPVMQGTGRYEVYELVKSELDYFEIIVENDLPVTESEYNNILKKFEPYEQHYKSDKEVVLIGAIETLYYLRLQVTNPSTPSEKIKEYIKYIDDGIDDLKMHLNEYEKMNGIPN